MNTKLRERKLEKEKPLSQEGERFTQPANQAIKNTLKRENFTIYQRLLQQMYLISIDSS